jgi:hypothetical protein
VWELAVRLAAARTELQGLADALRHIEHVPGLAQLAARLRPQVADLLRRLRDEHEELTARRW